MKALLIVLLFASPVAAQTVDPKPIAAFIAGSSFDMATTLYGLQSSSAIYEANPLLQVGGTPGLILIKSAATAAVAIALYRMTGQGHPKAAAVLGYLGGAVLSGIALHNMKVTNDVRAGLR